MAEVASFSSSSSIILSFPDHITGRRVSLSLTADETCYSLSPLQLRAQIKCPLELVKAAAWFLEQQSPLNRKRSWIALPPPLGHMLAAFSPHVPVRCMCSCVASACQRLVTAPANMHVAYRTTWRWVQCVMKRVTRGRARRVQERRPAAWFLCFPPRV